MYNYMHACVCTYLFLHLSAIPGIESRSSHMLDTCPTTGLVPKLKKYFLLNHLLSSNHNYITL